MEMRGRGSRGLCVSCSWRSAALASVGLRCNFRASLFIITDTSSSYRLVCGNNSCLVLSFCDDSKPTPHHTFFRGFRWYGALRQRMIPLPVVVCIPFQCRKRYDFVRPSIASIDTVRNQCHACAISDSLRSTRGRSRPRHANHLREVSY